MSSVGYIISEEIPVEFEIDWEALYGSLGTGKYRIGKGISDFKETGDYDTAMYYVEFEIKD